MIKMKKKLFVLLLVVMVLSMLSIPAFAGPPEEVGGEWSYIVTDVEVRVAGGNTFMTTYDEGVWTGTFEGVST